MKSLAFILFLLPSLAFSQSCVVERVVDGDTFMCPQETVRISSIDAPEKKQDFGMEAKWILNNMLLGKPVELSETTRDRYGRTVATVHLDGQDVGKTMVQKGLAWHYKKYSNNPTLSFDEEVARQNKTGLWVKPSPTPPWDYRKLDRLPKAP